MHFFSSSDVQSTKTINTPTNTSPHPPANPHLILLTNSLVSRVELIVFLSIEKQKRTKRTEQVVRLSESDAPILSEYSRLKWRSQINKTESKVAKAKIALSNSLTTNEIKRTSNCNVT